MRSPAFRHFVAGAVLFATTTGLAAQAAPAVPRPVTVYGIVDGATVVRTAREYLGVRYVLGGTTPRAFDCSGLIRYVFQRHGIAIPRTAHEQSALGRRPDDGDLQPGDLLFFYGGEGAQHIAIYIGNDSIIHASSSSKRVKVDKLAGSGKERTWFGERLIAVRRLLPAYGTFTIPAWTALTAAGPNEGEDPFDSFSLPKLF